MIGILTFHKAINYGAVLQAYALCTTVESLGQECHVINYAGEKMLAESKPLYFPNNLSVVDKLLYIYRLPMRIRTVKGFSSFLDDYLNLSGELISDAEDLRALAPLYDAFISGSDQVFNYNGTGEDFNFYLDFERDSSKKIAYAPSFGLNEIDDTHRAYIGECLGNFSALSVRESIGADIVEELLGERPKLVCDPTFLLDKAQWEALCITPKYKRPYVLVYSFGSCHLENIARRLADEIGAVVVNINRTFPKIVKGKNIINAYAPNPQEFLGLVNNAEIIVTNSFHGMALSIILHKEFYAFTNDYANSKATNARFLTFSDKLSLGDRILSVEDRFQRSMIDYDKVEKNIVSWREESLDFLKAAIRKI